MKKRHCKHCGAAIPTFGYSPSNYEKLQYCSNLCAHRAKSNPVEPRVCAMCGKVFTPLSKNRGQKCCSTACGVKFRQVRPERRVIGAGTLPELTWDDVFERVKKFHPELAKKIGLDSTEKQVEIIRRFNAETRGRKEDLYAWFYNRYICPDSRMFKLVIARTELTGKITKGELK